MNTKKLLETKKTAQELYSSQEFDKALEVIESGLNMSPGYLPLLILKAQAIQLLDEGFEKYGGLMGAKKILEDAIVLDKSSVYAKLELAHFLYVIENDPQKAIINAQEALKQCQEFITECNELIKECKKEIDCP